MYFAPKADHQQFDRSRPWSLAGRLAAWYAGSAFILVLVVSAILYWSLIDSIARSQEQVLLNKVHVLNRVLAAEKLDDARLRRVLDEGSDGPEPIFARVLLQDGQVFMESPDIPAGLPAAIFPAPQISLDPSPGIEFWTRSQRPYRILAVASWLAEQDVPVAIQVAADIATDHEIVARYREWLVVVLLASLLVVAVLGYQIARNSLRPLERVRQIAGRIGTSTLNERIALAHLPAEVRALAETFNKMMERLQDSFLQLRHLSDNIAHELRTPIQNIVNVAEIGLGKARSTEEYREHLESILEAGRQLSRIVQSLLFLARAENASIPIAYEILDVRDELERIREFFEAPAAEAGVDIVVQCPRGLTTRLDRTLMQRAVSNLVSNALASTLQGGLIELRGTVAAEEIRIEVRDNGSGIAAAHLPHIFDRFYRVDHTRAGGSGLGLSIVKSIAQLHDGDVEIQSRLGQGTNVVLRFPTSPRAAA
jgi:two-component system, OmpR family, heavy metal sensor histidine kinase CusS